jgi:transcriptional regulator with XRE-family HTH domain
VRKTIHSRQYEVFKQALRDARKASGVTQRELAHRLAMTQSAVSKIEMGEQRIDLIQLREWCEALGVKLSDFVDRMEDVLRGRARSSKRA